MSAAAIAVDAAHRPYEPSAANTSSACVSGLTFRITFTTVPSASITNVERYDRQLEHGVEESR